MYSPRAIPLFVLLAAACFFPGCSKSQRQHADTAIAGDINHEKRLASVAALNDQALLAEVAKHADNSPNRTKSIRLAAASKVTDQRLLLDLVKTAPDYFVQSSAIERLADENALADLARNNRDMHLSIAAAKRLADQRLLADLAKHAREPEVRLEAVRILTDQQTLADIAKNDTDHSMADAAMKRLTDQELLAGLAKLSEVPGESEAASKKNDRRRHIRFLAVQRLTDQQALAYVAKIDTDSTVREMAAERLTEQSALAYVAKNDGEEKVRRAAVVNLADQQALAHIATHDKSPNIRVAAANRLNDRKLLADFARQGEHAEVRLAAVWRLADRALLAGIATNDPSEPMRKAASEKLAGLAGGSGNTPPDNAPQNLADLINAGKVRLSARGNGIQRMGIVLIKMFPQTLEIIIPAGTYFVCDDSWVQNMVSTSAVRITLKEDSQNEDVPVACANRRRKVPWSKDTFTLGAAPGDELPKLMAVLGRENVSFAVKQAAVWIVTDNASYDDLSSLVTTHYGSSSQTTSETISKTDAAVAMGICRDAGIDVTTKRIWEQRAIVSEGIAAGELHDWLATPAKR